MSKHTAEIKVPVLSMEIRGEYSRFKKPAGLENLILTAIGTTALKRETWGDFFNRLSIPHRMAPLFKKMVENLYDNDVVDGYDFDLDYSIECLEFTDTGRDMFEQGRIKQDPKIFSDMVYFLPFAKYSDPGYCFNVKTVDDSGFHADRFSDILYDKAALKRYLIANKSHLGAEKDDDILSIEVNPDTDLLCASNKVDLLFDEASGDLSFETSIDTNFIKSYFHGEDLITEDSEMFRYPQGVVPKRTSNFPDDWDSFLYCLPNEYKRVSTLSVFDGSRCTMDGMTELDDFGYDFVNIVDCKVGRGYLFIMKQVAVQGLKGNVECPMLVSRKLSESEIKTVFDRVVEKFDISDHATVSALLPLASVSTDEDFAINLVRSHLKAVRDVKSSIPLLQKNKGVRVQKIPELVEEALSTRSETLDQIVTIVKGCNLKLNCDKLSRRDDVRSGNLLSHADKLLEICRSPSVLSATMGLGETIARFILDGNHSEFDSKELIAMDVASRNLGLLKNKLGINSICEFNLECFDDSERENVHKGYDSLVKSLKTVQPLMSGADGRKEIEKYSDLIQKLMEVCCTEIPLEKLTGYQFGAGIRRELETNLKKKVKPADLIVMINDAKELGLIDEDEQKIFHEIRNYGNKCLHTADVEPIPNKEKNAWVKAVQRLRIEETPNRLNGAKAPPTR